jgi:hypothetical protein
MADVKLVRGTVLGSPVETTEENAQRLGTTFEPEKSTAKKSSSSKSDK